MAPIIIQELLEPKTDLRVTVIGKKVYAVSILKENSGVKGDWRKGKNDVRFVPIDLPKDICQKCIDILHNLKLNFGAIDLIFCNEQYYFIEINPTGEWAWLVEAANQNTYIDIVDLLLNDGI